MKSIGCGLINQGLSSPYAEKSSSLPGSSQELAEIFGTSDDEEDMDFPFSLNVDKSFPDLNLTDGRVSEFFLKSINSLGGPVSSMDSALVAGDKLIPNLPATTVGSGIKGKDAAIAGVERVNSTTTIENVNTVPEVEAVDTVAGVERVNTDGDNPIPKEMKVVEGMEGVKESDEMEQSCAENNNDDKGKEAVVGGS